MSNKFLNEYKQFQTRNIRRIVRYRLRSFFNIKNNKTDNFFSKNKFLKQIFELWLTLAYSVNFLLNKKVSIPQIDFLITTNCTLNCENCASLVPYYDYDKRYNLSFNQFKSDLDNLLSSVDKIYRLKLIGGEPLLVEELNEMLEYVCKQKQVISVEITTNGTIIPDDKICETLAKYSRKALVVLSDYSENKDLNCIKFDEIRNKLEKYGIYSVYSKYNWFEIGNIKRQDKTNDELIQTFNECWQKDCLAISEGVVYNCTRSAAIASLTDFPLPQSEFVNIREQNNCSLLKKFNKFFAKEFYSTCSFCNTVLINDIEPSKQIQQNDFPRKIDINQN